MKRILLLIISASIAIAATGYAYAHPGRTDSQGGHTDRTTGEYHFHHGYPAHQHEDRDGDGVKEYCPYEFSDDTGSSSGASSSRAKTQAVTPAPEQKITIRATTATTETTPPTTAAVYSLGSAESNNSDGEEPIVIGLAAVCLIICILWAVVQKSNSEQEIQRIKDLSDTFRRDAAQEELVLVKRIRVLTESLDAETEKTRQYKTEASQMKVQLAATQQQAKELQEKVDELSVRLSRESYRAMQAEKEYGVLQDEFADTVENLHKIGNPEEGQTEEERILALAQEIQEKDEKIQALSTELEKHIQREKIPRDVFYAADGMPVQLKYIPQKYGDFTVYLNRETKVYHADKYCAPLFAYPQHLFNILRMHGTRPCMKCAKNLPTELPDWWDAQKK